MDTVPVVIKVTELDLLVHVILDIKEQLVESVKMVIIKRIMNVKNINALVLMELVQKDHFVVVNQQKILKVNVLVVGHGI